MKRHFTKKPVLATTDTQSWPSSDEWAGVYLYEDEEMWERYLSQPEETVNDELQIFPEPSVQAGMGDVYIHDESGNYDDILVDYKEWCSAELKMAASSKSASEYEEKYRKYVSDIINKNWN